MKFTRLSFFFLLSVAIFYSSQLLAEDTNVNGLGVLKTSSPASYGLDKRVKIMGALLLIFAPIGILAYHKNKGKINGSESLINILEKRTIDPTSSLILVKTYERTFLLGKSAEKISLLTELNLKENGSNESEYSNFANNNLSLISNI